MKKLNKLVSVFLSFTLVLSLLVVSASASPVDVVCSSRGLTFGEMSLQEMEQVSRYAQSGVSPYINLIDDVVGVAMTKTSNGGAEFHIMNVGFPLDVVDSVEGTIILLGSDGKGLGKADVAEYNLVYGISRKYTLYPQYGKFYCASVTLTITDGGQSQTSSKIYY